MSFREISPYNLKENVFDMYNNQWALVTAEKEGKLNTMTISWGGLGILWSMPVAFTFVRHGRYTFEFTEAADTFSITLYDESFRDALAFCGSRSGRDVDKVEHCGFTVAKDGDTPYFEEAKVVLICRKLYAQQLEADCAMFKEFGNIYSDGDIHKMYITKIEKVLIKE